MAGPEKQVFPKNILTREGIITNMCYTWRHDFGAPVDPSFPGLGMTQEQRESLWNRMAQIYDNDIAPFHKLKKA